MTRNLTLDNTAEVVMTEHKNVVGWNVDVKKEEIRATCHLCNPPRGFASIDELQQHTLKDHRVYKG